MIHLVVPQLPPPGLSANARRRLHPLKARALIADAKAEWYELLVGALWEQHGSVTVPGIPWDRVRITYTITWPTRRMLDYDNLLGGGRKVGADLLQAPQGIADQSFRLGLIRDDSPTCVISSPGLEYHYQKGVSETDIKIVQVIDEDEAAIRDIS